MTLLMVANLVEKRSLNLCLAWPELELHMAVMSPAMVHTQAH